VSLYVNLLKTMCGCVLIIIIKAFHLNSCATVRQYLGRLCAVVPEYSSAITSTFAINCVSLVAISYILSAIYWNSNEYSAGTSGCNIAILLFFKIHNFQWNHTRRRDADVFAIGK
jgi:hypothetical protein